MDLTVEGKIYLDGSLINCCIGIQKKEKKHHIQHKVLIINIYFSQSWLLFFAFACTFVSLYDFDI